MKQTIVAKITGVSVSLVQKITIGKNKDNYGIKDLLNISDYDFLRPIIGHPTMPEICETASKFCKDFEARLDSTKLYGAYEYLNSYEKNTDYNWTMINCDYIYKLLEKNTMKEICLAAMKCKTISARIHVHNIADLHQKLTIPKN